MSADEQAPSILSLLRRGVVWLFYGWMRLMVLLPFRWQLAAGKRLGTLARVLLPGKRRIAERNLEVCFPQLTAEQRGELLRRHFQSIGAGVAETAMGWFGPTKTIERLVRVEGVEHLQRALERGKGVILFCGHFTTFEFFGPKMRRLCPRLSAMYKRQRNPVMNDIMRRGRERTFDELFPKDSVKAMLKSLAQNSVVWYASDQSFGRKHSALIPFFGEPAMTNTAASRIALRSGATVLPYFCRRLPDNSAYVMTFGAPLDGFPTADAVEDTRRLMGLLEDYVKLCPEQYAWIHQRFKGRPQPYPDIYATRGSHA
jgi:KDO2-lipid IV(A) lauroyltransferase